MTYLEEGLCIDRGEQLLDDYFGGPDWRGHIDTEKLEISSVERCVLGQLFGVYERGLFVLGLEGGCYHGFAGSIFITDAWRSRLASWQSDHELARSA